MPAYLCHAPTNPHVIDADVTDLPLFVYDVKASEGNSIVQLQASKSLGNGSSLIREERYLNFPQPCDLGGVGPLKMNSVSVETATTWQLLALKSSNLSENSTISVEHTNDQSME